MRAVELSIIIVSYNTKEATIKCLESVQKSLQNSKIAYEIIIVDNNSFDATVSEIKNRELKIGNLRLVENKSNVGFGKANNQGVKKALGRYILLLNSDTVILDNAIDSMYRYIDTNSGVYFLGSKLLNSDMTPQPSCGPFYTLPVVFGALFLRGDYWGLTRQSPNTTKKVDWISGACIMTKKETYEKTGGFDEGIFMYMEEIDFLYRAKKMGFATYFFPEAHIIHYGSLSSGGKTYPIVQVYKGFLYLYRKHFPKWQMFCLKSMLKLKALISIGIGRLTKNDYLIKTYEKAIEMVEADR